MPVQLLDMELPEDSGFVSSGHTAAASTAHPAVQIAQTASTDTSHQPRTVSDASSRTHPGKLQQQQQQRPPPPPQPSKQDSEAASFGLDPHTARHAAPDPDGRPPPCHCAWLCIHSVQIKPLLFLADSSFTRPLPCLRPIIYFNLDHEDFHRKQQQSSLLHGCIEEASSRAVRKGNHCCG